MKRLIYFAAIFLFCSSSFLYGNGSEQDSIRREKIGEVVVTANRISVPLRINPGAVTLVRAFDLRNMPRGIAADEALRLVPGVRIDNQANGSRVHMSIRGQGILSEHGLRGIKVLIDGIPVNDPSGFAPDLYDVDWAVVKDIEVLRGPSASLYGGGANAGVLNIITRSGRDKPLGGMAYSVAGSNGFHKILLQTDGHTGNLNYRISASGIKGNGYREHTGFRGNNMSEKIQWKLSGKISLTQILMITDYFNKNAEGLNLSQLDNPVQANPDAIPFNEYQKTDRVTNGVTGHIRIKRNQELRFTGFMRLTRYKEPGSSTVEYNMIKTPGISLQYNFNTTTSRLSNHLSIGTDYEYQYILEYKVPNLKVPGRTEKIGDFDETIREDTVLLAHQDIHQWSAGIYMIDRLTLWDHLTAMFSLRYDNMNNSLTDKMNRPEKLSGEVDFKKVSARLGLMYAFSPALNIYINRGQGFLPPSTEELSSNPESFGGFNKNLVPAVSSGTEIGVRGYRGKKLFYDLTLFTLYTRNDFYRYRILPQRPLETFYGNAGSTKRYGLESYVSWMPLDNLTLKAAYTYSHFQYASPDSICGNPLPNSPKHQFTADIDYRFLSRFSVGVSTELQTKWYIYTDRVHKDISQDGFSLYHLRAGYDFKIGKTSGTLSVYGKNITNVSYIAFTEPDPDGNSYQPAARREYFASVRLRF